MINNEAFEDLIAANRNFEIYMPTFLRDNHCGCLLGNWALYGEQCPIKVYFQGRFVRVSNVSDEEICSHLGISYMTYCYLFDSKSACSRSGPEAFNTLIEYYEKAQVSESIGTSSMVEKQGRILPEVSGGYPPSRVPTNPTNERRLGV